MSTRPERGRGWAVLRQVVAEQKAGLLLGAGAGVIWTLAKVSVPRFVQLAIDQGMEDGDRAALRHWTLAIAIAGVTAALFTGIRRYNAFKQSRLAEARLRDRMFAQIMRLQFEFHDRMQTGELMSRANTDLQQIQHAIVLFPLTVSNAVTVLAVVVILGSIDPFLTLLALGSLPLLNVFGRMFSNRLHPRVMGIQEQSAELAAVVEETVSGVRVVKGFGAEAVMGSRFETEATDVYDESLGAARIRASFLPAMELLPNIGMVLVLLVGGHRVLDGSLTVGEFTAFNLYVALLIWPLRMLGMIVAQTQRALASGERVAEILDEAPTIAPPTHPLPAPTTAPAIEFRDVTFAYPTSRLVLDRFDLRVEPGETVALVGATASGKSTVMRLIARYYDTDRGRVCLDGVDVRDFDPTALRRCVGVVFEETFLFSDTISANIAFGRPEATRAEIDRASRQAGAHDFITELPAGYGTEVGERGFSLSGGQRQRLAIARAIVSDPGVLVLDDATSAVDPTKEHEIHDSIRAVTSGRTTIVIAHRPATIALADRVVLVDGGRVADSGRHDELLGRSERYRDVLVAAERHDREAADAVTTGGGGAGDE